MLFGLHGRLPDDLRGFSEWDPLREPRDQRRVGTRLRKEELRGGQGSPLARQSILYLFVLDPEFGFGDEGFRHERDLG